MLLLRRAVINPNPRAAAEWGSADLAVASSRYSNPLGVVVQEGQAAFEDDRLIGEWHRLVAEDLAGSVAPSGKQNGQLGANTESRKCRGPFSSTSIGNRTRPSLTSVPSSLRSALVKLPGFSFHVRSAGAGPLVVLLHGFPGSGEIWRMQVPALVAAGHRVLVPDLRGFGETEAPPEVGSYRLERLMADLFDIVDVAAPEVRQFDVIGHDWGARVGWLGSIAEPERIRRFAALSVGHPEAYRRAGLEQKLKGWYLLLFATPILAEAALAAGSFRMLRRQAPRAEDGARWSRDLARPGRLTAGLNWYRANLRDALGARVPPSAVPALGVYSRGTSRLPRTRCATRQSTSPQSGAMSASTASDIGCRSKRQIG